MTAFLAWVLVAACVTVISWLTDDPHSLVAMFIISVLMPEDVFVEGV